LIQGFRNSGIQGFRDSGFWIIKIEAGPHIKSMKDNCTGRRNSSKIIPFTSAVKSEQLPAANAGRIAGSRLPKR